MTLLPFPGLLPTLFHISVSVPFPFLWVLVTSQICLFLLGFSWLAQRTCGILLSAEWLAVACPGPSPSRAILATLRSETSVADPTGDLLDRVFTVLFAESFQVVEPKFESYFVEESLGLFPAKFVLKNQFLNVFVMNKTSVL